MTDEQGAILAASCEVLAQAVKLLLAESIKRAPPDERQNTVAMLREQLSKVPNAGLMSDQHAVAYSDLAVHIPTVAKALMDDVQRRIGQG